MGSNRKIDISECEVLPYIYEVSLTDVKAKFMEELKEMYNFRENQTVWFYTETDEKHILHLHAISTNLNGELGILGLQKALNKANGQNLK